MYISGARIYIYFAVLVFLNTAHSQRQCPYRWYTNDKDPTSTSCYFVTTSIYRTWQESERYCKNMGGDLLKIDTVAEWNWLRELTSQYNKLGSHPAEWWIGLHDNPTQTRVVWPDKSGINSNIPIQWSAGEPRTYNHQKACVEFYINNNNNNNSSGVMRHQDCSGHHALVCERPQSSAVWCDADNRWENINGLCYKAMTHLMTWDDARSACVNSNANLMTVKDEASQHILDNFIDTKRATMWIGLRAYPDSQGNVTFRWGGPTGLHLQTLPVYWGHDPMQAVQRTGGNSSCVAGYTSLARPKDWAISNCSRTSFSVCQKAQGFCSAGWIQSQSRCYYISTRNKLSWSDANSYCKQRGADLLKIRGPLTEDFINRNLPDLGMRRIDSIWLGLYDNNKDGNNWMWGDNSRFVISPYVYNNFPRGQPPSNRPGQMDCFNIFTDDVNGTWQIASDCRTNKSFVCSIPINRAPSRPTLPTTAAITGPTTTPTPVTWSTQCGVNWILDYVTGYCYKFVDRTVGWSVGRSACLGEGADLVSINSIHEQWFISERLFGYQAPALWLGMNSLNTNAGYQWTDGTGFGFMNWSPGEPNNHGYLDENCGEIVSGGPTVGKWNDVGCTARRGYICKKKRPGFPTNSPPTMLPPGDGMKWGCPDIRWTGYTGKCFLFMHTRTNWLNAQKYCKSHGVTLASIADENEQNFVFSQLGIIAIKLDDHDDLYWTGLNDVANQMRFSWTDYRDVTYTNWEAGEPDNAQTGRQDCVPMHKQTGRWQDVECDIPLSGFICKTGKRIMHSEVPQKDVAHGCSVNGYVAYGYSCYQFIASPVTWNAAKTQCQASGGRLAEIHDRWQQAFIASQVYSIPGNFWIGLRIRDSNHMRWDSNATLDFTAWSANHTGLENSTCVSLQTKTPGAGLWVNTNCGSSQNYICQTARTGYSTIHTTTPTTTAPLVCPTGWHKFQGYCYKAYTARTDRRSFFDARDMCRSMGTHLISIHSKDEERFAFSYRMTSSTTSFGSFTYTYARSFWIGLNDFDVERGYTWTDGTQFDYQNWGRGEPNDPKGADDCVDYNKYGSNWNDNNCYITKAFVCKVQLGTTLLNPPATAATTPSTLCGGTSDWYQYNGSCYYVSPKYGSDGKKTWYDARTYCMAQGGDLASVHSEQENGFIIKTLTRTLDASCWLGMNDVGIDQFAWFDGTLWDYEKWSPNEPSDSYGSEKCGQIFAFNGYWNDYDCNTKCNYICKRPVGTTHPVTVPRTTVLPGNCPPDFTRVPNDNRCYKIVGGNRNGWLNYTMARDACRKMGTGFDIATIGNKKQQSMLVHMTENTQLRSGDTLWIGLQDLNKNRRFTWQDNAQLAMTNWGKGQPANTWSAKCVVMYKDMRRAGKWHNTDCGSLHGYVCEAKPNATYPTPQPPIGHCSKPGYVSTGISCYRLHLMPMNWTTAVSACNTDGANLVSILNIYEQAYVDVMTIDIDAPVWIGLGDQSNTGTYSWVDTWPVIYDSWGPGEPTYETSEGCVTTNNGYWNDTICSLKYPFFCKQSFYTPPPSTAIVGGHCKDKTWKQFGNHCYDLNLMAGMTWASAEADCKSRGMELASIRSKQEELFILRLVDSDKSRNDNVWIGMRKTGPYFHWSDGSPANYIDWETGEPSDMANLMHEDCVELKHDTGKWNDARCTNRNGYVCKANKLPAMSTSTSATLPSTSTKTSSASKNMSPTPSYTSSPLTSLYSLLPTGFERITDKVAIRTTRKATTASPRSIGQTTPTTQRIAQTPGSQSQGNTKDLSSAQVGGVIAGVLAALLLLCGVLLYVKNKSGSQLFSFRRLRDGKGFTNVMYDKNQQLAKIDGNKTNSNGTTNGHSIGFRDFGDDMET